MSSEKIDSNPQSLDSFHNKSQKNNDHLGGALDLEQFIFHAAFHRLLRWFQWLKS